MTHILCCHDAEYFAATKAELLRRSGREVTACETAIQSLEAIARCGQTIDVAVIHKDIGELLREGITVETIVAALRNKEILIRTGIISGEFPHGLPHVLNFGADFYFSTTLPNENRWLLNQLDAGLVSPNELEQRGQKVATPSGYRERH